MPGVERDLDRLGLEREAYQAQAVEGGEDLPGVLGDDRDQVGPLHEGGPGST